MIGKWMAMLSALIKFYKGNPGLLQTLELLDFYKSPSGIEMRKCHQQFTPLKNVSNSVPQTNGAFLRFFNEYRNTYAHPLRVEPEEAAEAVPYLESAMEELLIELYFLGSYRLGYLENVTQPAGGNNYKGTILNLTGEQPRTIRGSQLVGTQSHEGEIYLSKHAASYDPICSLHPLLVYDRCTEPTCRVRPQRKIAFFNGLTRQGWLNYNVSCRHTLTNQSDSYNLRLAIAGAQAAVVILSTSVHPSVAGRQAKRVRYVPRRPESS